MSNVDTKPSLYDALRLAKDERAAFLYIDLLVGSAGVWLPLIVGIVVSTTTVGKEMGQLIDSAGIYIFALAFLSTSSSFLYLERKNNPLNEIRESYSNNTGIKTMLLIGLGWLLTGLQLGNGSNCWLIFCQFAYLIAAIWLGFHLFCLKNVEKIPGETERIRAKQEEFRNKILQSAMTKETF